MITKTVDVKSDGKVVGQASYPVFESVEDLTSNMPGTDLLKLVNAQVRTNKMNEVRAAAVGKPTNKTLMLQALSELSTEQLVECAGDKAKLQSLVDAKVAEIVAREAKA
jgi:hypothetical protein